MINKISKIPNELTAATLRKSEEGKKLNKVDNVEKLFEELERSEVIVPANSKEITKE